MQYLLLFIVALFLFPYALCLIDMIKKTHYSCNIFSWHNGKGSSHSYDGCSFHSTCSKCGEKVMQDGQGNWF